MKHVYSSIFTVALFTLSAFNAYAQGPNDSGTYYQAADGKKGGSGTENGFVWDNI